MLSKSESNKDICPVNCVQNQHNYRTRVNAESICVEKLSSACRYVREHLAVFRGLQWLGCQLNYYLAKFLPIFLLSYLIVSCPPRSMRTPRATALCRTGTLSNWKSSSKQSVGRPLLQMADQRESDRNMAFGIADSHRNLSTSLLDAARV